MKPALDLEEALALGERLSRLGQSDARKALREAERFVTRTGRFAPVAVRATARRARGHAHRGNYDFRRALVDYRAALRGFVAARLPLERARTAIGMTDVLINLNRPREALALANATRRTLRAAGEWRRVARLEVNVANLHLRHDRLALALARYRAAERWFARAGHARDLALTRFNIANVLVEQGRFSEALPAFDASAELLSREGAERALVQCHLAHADARVHLGRFGEALAILERARVTAEQLGDRQLDAMAAVATARVLVSTGRHAEADAPLDRAVAKFAAATLRWDEGTTLVLRARWHGRAGRTEAAMADLDGAAAAFRAVGQTSLATWTRVERIRLGGPRRLTQGERATLVRAAAVFRKSRQGVHEMEARLMLAADAQERDAVAEARGHLSRIATLLSRHADPWLEQQWALASAGLAGMPKERVLARLERAAAVADRLRSRIPEESMRAAYSAEQAEIVERALEIVLRGAAGAPSDGSVRAAFVWSERAHTPRLGVADDGPGERRRPQLTAASVARLQRGLADGECLIEYFVGRFAVHRFVVSRARVVHARLAVAPAALRERVFALRRLWDRFTLDARGGARRRAALRESERELLAGLHDDLLGGAIEEGARRVTIVPHSWLRDVPFHALGRDAPLAAGPRVDYLLSARERLRPQRAQRRPSGVPLVVGVASPQAPSAEREARAVAACHPDARVLCGDDATPDALRSAWSNASLIHVATHASRDLDEPRRSGVQLGAGSWTAFDVAREGMAADLVVLSGCRTGDAVVWGGDEAFGLLPALREAGDAAVLVSLWAVEDGAADAWMQRFHGALAAGTPAAAAWQVAVAESRSQADSAYHWAPFALYGQRWSQGR